MDINRNNYEAWLLDLMEGSLSADEVQGVRDFLLLNPDCDSGLDEQDTWMLDVKDLSYSGKEGLRKVLPDHSSKFSETDFDLFSIAMLEGDLTRTQEEEYFQELKGDEDKLREWLQWKQLKLEAKNILFDRKDLLKKRTAPRSRVIWISIASAAAALLLFFSLLDFDQGFNPNTQIPPETEAYIESPGEMEATEATEITESTETPGISPLSEELFTEKPAIKDSEPAKFSIKKHQAPPEKPDQINDTIQTNVQEASLQERPLKLARLDRSLMKQHLRVSYDKIEVLELAGYLAYSDQGAEDIYAEDGLRRSYKEFVEKQNISLLRIASAGVKGINKLSGSDLSLDISRDGEGEVKGFRFRSSLLSVDSPVKKQNISR